MSFTLSEFNYGAVASSTASHDMERPTEEVTYFDCGSIGDSDSITNTNQTQDCYGDFNPGAAKTTVISSPSREKEGLLLKKL
jgi:hypothetical protein